MDNGLYGNYADKKKIQGKGMNKRNSDIDRRGRELSKGKRGDGPVVYWLSRDQRVGDNWALLWAQQEAIIRQKSLHVVFCLIPDYPGANLRHYHFMLDGLTELARKLAHHQIGFEILEGSPVERLPQYLIKHDAHALVCDFDPLKIKRLWKKQLIKSLSMPIYEVDTHNIIPAWEVSDKKEYAAYTIRPKVKRLLADYLTDIPALEHHPILPVTSSPANIKRLAEQVSDKSVSPLSWLQAGENAATMAMKRALKERLPNYAADRNNPCAQGQSGLSPYLHFGHLSPQRLAFVVSHSELAIEVKEDFLEELVVRRELADNFCFYEPAYDHISGFSEWARKSLQVHRKDQRDYLYSLTHLEQAETHEPLWNACQVDLVNNGKLHGFLRMYWAKKILEWTRSPEEALECAIRLNDRYSLDGRDPNGYTGIAWSIGGVHDRAWKERPVFGKIRYMNEAGCRRKFDVAAYISTVYDNL
jgi:deoxyribodipyrimidine photo-lyase